MSPYVTANGIRTWYDTFGDANDAPMLLISGSGSQAISWPVAFCESLAAEGFFVVRYDLRDVGLTDKLPDAPVPDPVALAERKPVPLAYTLKDLAVDAVGLLDALGLFSAHLLGRSLGGMIAQVVAFEYPHRVRSLCLISSTTGDPSVGGADPTVAASLAGQPHASEKETIAAMAAGYEMRGTPGAASREELLERAETAFHRSHYPEGVLRNLAAALAAPDRTEALRGLRVPGLVIHGTADRLVDFSGGEALARAIPGATLLPIEGMGHDLPPFSWATVINAVSSNAGK